MLEKGLRYLNGFVEVAGCRNISEAARRLGISQPSLSRQIIVLEELVGVPLVVRDGGGVKLTPAGHSFFNAIKAPFQDIEKALEATAQSAKAIEGKIILGALTEVGQSILFPAILEFRKKFQAIDFDVQYLKEFEIKQKIKDGKLDVGVVTTPVDSEKMASQLLTGERVVLVTRQQNPVDINEVQDLREKSFIAYREGDPLLNLFLKKHFPSYAKKWVEPVVAVNSHNSMLEALACIDSYAVMPWQSVQEQVNLRLLRLASSLELSGDLYLIFTAGKRRRIEQMFTDFLLAQIGPE